MQRDLKELVVLVETGNLLATKTRLTVLGLQSKSEVG